MAMSYESTTMDRYNTTSDFITTTESNDVPEFDVIMGYCCIGIACLFFGIFNLPVKHFATGDGMFFQLLVGLAIWSVSLIVHCVRGFPQFYALPMLGGLFWSTANLQTVPVIKLLGIGISQTLNNLVSLIFGWAYARFGWFGIKPEVPSNVGLNYAGVIVCALSVIIYLFVKVETNNAVEQEPMVNSDENTPINSNSSSYGSVNNEKEEAQEFYDKMSEVQKKTFGTVIAIIGGVFFGSTFAPILYVQDNYPNASKNGNDYSFSLGTGILLSSMFYFIVYCIYKKNKPRIYPELILPSFTTGWLWNIANTSYFVATTSLSQAVSFPISFSGPSIIASLFGFWYKEINGRNNILILILAMLATLVGIVLCALSF